ncbi:MAG: sulfatase [Planctomycetaceae bacterium]
MHCLKLPSFVMVCLVSAAALIQAADTRPNIVWISVEDISAHLGCYGDRNATTPHLDELAKQGVRYTHAFTCHGVCAPSRTGIITGMYPIGLGANHMRSKATLPEHVRCFPQYLREAGYYCTNNSKTDYNFHWKQADVWDESSNKAHWKNRPQPDQPFFAVFNLTSSHESQIWPKNWEKQVKGVPREQLHDPSRIRVPPLYPETTAVKEAHARLLDIIMVTDQRIGKYLQELDDSGLADRTIVIFWSDHGDGFPRSKRWIYDSGTRVPMIVRIPEKLRTDGQGQPGTADNRLVNLIDLGPTVLNLAGIQVPEHMFGQPFLGANLPAARKYTYAARDRVDERFDMVRSVRDQQFRYVRNYNPWRPALQHIDYSENSVVRKEIRRLAAEGRLPAEIAQFLAVPRPAEELYDSEADPWELKNLAGVPEHQETLQRLRDECLRWQMESGDAHLIPESLLDAEEAQAGSRWDILNTADSGMDRLDRLILAAQTASAPRASDQPELLRMAAAEDPAERWWGIHGLAFQNAADPAALTAFRTAAKDNVAAVRVAAGRALRIAGQLKEALAVLTPALQDKSEFIRHAAATEIDEAGPDAVAAAEQQLKTMPGADDGYIGRIVAHALGQLKK